MSRLSSNDEQGAGRAHADEDQGGQLGTSSWTDLQRSTDERARKGEDEARHELRAVHGCPLRREQTIVAC
jgi:hypothetical protein